LTPFLAKARKQITILRNICADRKGKPLGLAKSNYNPKTVTVLQLVLECLQRGEQAVVVSARTGQTDEYYFRLAAAIGEPKLARIDSTVLPSEHAAEADRFKRGEARVLFMGIRCARGYSLVCPSYCT
jgi:primosomal protein N'